MESQPNTFETILEHLHRGGVWSYWWIDNGKKSIWWPVGDWAPVPNGKTNVYFGVHPVSKIPSTNSRGEPVEPSEARGQNNHVSAINCLFGDFDAKDFGNDKDNVLLHVGKLDPPPTLTIDSGGGYHCYWFLKEAFLLNYDTARDRAINIQRRWVDFIGSDKAVKDLARVFRVPGTRNFKTEYAPQFPTVSILEFEKTRLYDIDHLESILPEEKKKETKENNLALSDEQIINRALTAKNGVKFAKLWSGDISDYKSQSEADFALCCMLAFWTGKDKDRIDAIFRQSGLYRDKWDRDDYREHTIDGAVQATEETYTPRDPKTADYIAALERLGYTFKMNMCSDTVEVNEIEMSDPIRAKIRSQLRDAGYAKVNVAEDAWIASAYDNGYHPVRKYLAELEWDEKDTIGELCKYFNDDRAFFEPFFTRWLIGAVARACEKKSTQNRMLVLDGKQNLGKSSFVRWLASAIDRPEIYIESPINPDDKDSLIRLTRCWIWEVSEIDSTTRRSDREALKNFLSLQQVTVRKPYGHYDLVKPALSSFIGTLNNVGGFLNDPTGYRRFMAVNLVKIDWDYVSVDVNQVWAQAKTLYDSGMTWNLDVDEIKMARVTNLRYEIEDPLDDLIQRHFEITRNPIDFLPTLDIKELLNGQGWRLRTPRAESMAIAGVMKSLNVEKKKTTTPPRGYVGIRRRAI